MKKWLKQRAAALLDDPAGQIVHAATIAGISLIVVLYLWLEDKAGRTPALTAAAAGAGALVGVLIGLHCWLQAKFRKRDEAGKALPPEEEEGNEAPRNGAGPPD